MALITLTICEAPRRLTTSADARPARSGAQTLLGPAESNPVSWKLLDAVSLHCGTGVFRTGEWFEIYIFESLFFGVLLAAHINFLKFTSHLYCLFSKKVISCTQLSSKFED